MLKIATTITELLMVTYWVFAAALSTKFISIDPALMYSDFENPMVVAWNWSFFPIDIAFALTGLIATFGRISNELRFKLKITSSTLMICAGLMAVSFWVLTRDFVPTWWAMNIWLVFLGLANLYSTKLNNA